MQGIEILVHVLETVRHAQPAEVTQRATRVLAPVGSVHGDHHSDSILMAITLPLRVAARPTDPRLPRSLADARPSPPYSGRAMSDGLYSQERCELRTIAR